MLLAVIVSRFQSCDLSSKRKISDSATAQTDSMTVDSYLHRSCFASEKESVLFNFKRNTSEKRKIQNHHIRTLVNRHCWGVFSHMVWNHQINSTEFIYHKPLVHWFSYSILFTVCEATVESVGIIIFINCFTFFGRIHHLFNQFLILFWDFSPKNYLVFSLPVSYIQVVIENWVYESIDIFSSLTNFFSRKRIGNWFKDKNTLKFNDSIDNYLKKSRYFHIKLFHKKTRSFDFHFIRIEKCDRFSGANRMASLQTPRFELSAYAYA